MARSSEETKSVNFKFGGFGIAILIIFAIILNNMKNEEVEEQNLQAYWKYAWVSLICSIIQAVIVIFYAPTLAYLIQKRKENVIGLFTGVACTLIFFSIMGYIIYMFKLISDNKEVTKFKFVDDTEGTYSYMLQVCCMIMFVVDMILFAIICIGFILLLISLFEYLCCSNEQNTSVPRASSPNKANTLAVITDLESQA